MQSIYGFPFDRPVVAAAVTSARAARSRLETLVTGALYSWPQAGEPVTRADAGPLDGRYVVERGPAMQAFAAWFDGPTAAVQHDVLRSGLAYLWLRLMPLSEQPGPAFAAEIVDRSFDRSCKTGRRFFVMSQQLAGEREVREMALAAVPPLPNGGEATAWLCWFCGCYERALCLAAQAIAGGARRAAFWTAYRGYAFNARQRALVGDLLHARIETVTAKDLALQSAVSVDTATRDLNALQRAGILGRRGSARSTRFVLEKE
ncbi:MAG: hypothetical protein ABR508_04765 [Candidatus Baltobacteraceae bacterium]